MHLPSEPPRPTIIIDRREKNPWEFRGLQTRSATLQTGDYSIVGMEHLVAVERKSLSDFLQCCGVERPRFEREMQRILAYPNRLVVLETDWDELSRGEWRSQITPTQAAGSILGWQSSGVPFLLAGSRDRAARLAQRWLEITHRRQWRSLRALSNTTVTEEACISSASRNGGN